MTLNTEKTNLLKRLAEQEMATKEAKQEAKEAIVEKEEAEVKMIHAQEIAATHENTMSAMRREMKQRLEQVEEQNKLVYYTALQQNERDMMSAEEYVSRYNMMQVEYREAMQEKQENWQALQDYKTIHTVVKLFESQRDEAAGERDKHADRIDELENEIKKLKQDHINEMKTKDADHNIEINELE